MEEEESMFKEAPLKNAETEDPEYQAARVVRRLGKGKRDGRKKNDVVSDIFLFLFFY